MAESISRGYQAGSLLMLAVEGLELSSDERELFTSATPAGVTLFKRNLTDDPGQVQHLIEQIQSTRPANSPPLLIAVDQEGGRVSRLSMVPDPGPPLKVYEGTTPESLKKLVDYGLSLGKHLRLLGFNVNFAPVVDILTNNGNHAIGDRVFGREARSVSLRAAAFLEGLQSAGIAGCLKHFPGQGHAGGDTHENSIQIDLTLQELHLRELIPFINLLNQCPLVMASHCIYPKISPKPASLSCEILTDLLRNQLGFGGLIVSDDMNMKALPQQENEWGQSIVECLKAGGDLILVCQGLDKCQQAIKFIREECNADQTFRASVQNKAQKISKLRTTFVQ